MGICHLSKKANLLYLQRITSTAGFNSWYVKPPIMLWITGVSWQMCGFIQSRLLKCLTVLISLIDIQHGNKLFKIFPQSRMLHKTAGK